VFVMIGVLTNLSITQLFLAGAVPDCSMEPS
jgi:TRAP-type C4-dicarboxylate transport system permease large subunit